MSKLFAAWIHVTPSPTTLAESSAILQSLTKLSQVSTFVRTKPTDRPTSAGQKAAAADGTSYYAVFQQPLKDGDMNFTVPVYHDVEPPEQADPYNIRGLRHRKPVPAPKVFNCVVRKDDDEEGQSWSQLPKNPYFGSFRVDAQSPLRKILIESGAPRSIASRLCPLLASESEPQNEHEWHLAQTSAYREQEGNTSHLLPMDALMRPWREAVEADMHSKTEAEAGAEAEAEETTEKS